MQSRRPLPLADELEDEDMELEQESTALGPRLTAQQQMDHLMYALPKLRRRDEFVGVLPVPNVQVRGLGMLRMWGCAAVKWGPCQHFRKRHGTVLPPRDAHVVNESNAGRVISHSFTLQEDAEAQPTAEPDPEPETWDEWDLRALVEKRRCREKREAVSWQGYQRMSACAGLFPERTQHTWRMDLVGGHANAWGDRLQGENI